TGWMNTATFSADGSMIVTTNKDGTVRIWDAANGRLRTRIDAQALTASFSPDGSVLLSGAGDVARLWDTRTGHLLDSLVGIDDVVVAASFSPDGKSVLVAGGVAKVFPCQVCGSVRDLVTAASARITRRLTAEERRLYLG